MANLAWLIQPTFQCQQIEFAVSDRQDRPVGWLVAPEEPAALCHRQLPLPFGSLRTMLAIAARMLLFAITSSAVVGCAKWKSVPDQVSTPLPTKPAAERPEVVSLETVIVRFPTTMAQELEQLWIHVDESVVEIETRRQLARNGIRAGVLLGELPSLLRKRMQDVGRAQQTDPVESAGLAVDADQRMHRLQCRAGKPKSLLVRRPLKKKLHILTVSNDGSITGASYSDPSMMFDLRVLPLGGETARVSLCPEVQYGELQRAYVSSEAGIRPTFERPRQRWKELSIDLELREQEVLMVGAILPPKALGQAFFTTQTAEQEVEHLVLLVRLSETHVDELFAPEQLEMARGAAERP